MFRAISHMITIGYGIDPPYNLTEVIMVMISMSIGAVFYVLLVGMISSLMQSMDKSGTMYVERMQMWKVSNPESIKSNIHVSEFLALIATYECVYMLPRNLPSRLKIIILHMQGAGPFSAWFHTMTLLD